VYDIIARTQQVPVGQGGLHSGEVVTLGHGGPDRRFTYMFDCGSVNREHLEQGLQLCPDGQLDLLFISHLDADHVNGIDALAAKTQIHAIVLPCLDALQLTVIACEATSDGGLRGSVRSFLKDPTGWCAERGIRKIYQIRRGGNGELPNPFDPEGDNPGEIDQEENRPNDDKPFTLKIRSNALSGSVARTKTGTVELKVFGDATSMELVPVVGQLAGQAAWVFVPYVHPFAEDTVALFRRAVAKVLAVPDSLDPASPNFTRRLLACLEDETTRRALKACYSILSSDNNKPSLSLYAGPLGRPFGTVRRSHEWTDSHDFIVDPSHWSRRDEASAWLCTGDANLKARATRTPWLARYERLLEKVDVFVLPHHGSNHNLHDDVLLHLRGAVMLACAASGRSHHPHGELLKRLRRFGNGVWQVSEDMGSRYLTDVHLRAA